MVLGDARGSPAPPRARRCGGGQGRPLRRSGLRVGRLAAGRGHADRAVAGVGAARPAAHRRGRSRRRGAPSTVGRCPARWRRTAWGASHASLHGVCRSGCHASCHGDGAGVRRRGHGRCQRGPGSLVADSGTDRVPHTKGTLMTTSSSAPDAVDLAAGRGVRPRGRRSTRAIAYNAVLVYLGDRLGLWQAARLRRLAPPAPSSRSAPGWPSATCASGSSAQAAAGYVIYDAGTGVLHACRPSTRWCSPTRTARPPASPASR